MKERETTNNILDFDASSLQVYITTAQELKDNQHGRLLFNGNDIKEYKWKTQELVFKPEFLKGKESNSFDTQSQEYLLSKGSKLLGAKSTDMFELVLNGHRIYYGYFKQSALSSFLPQGPEIEDINNGIKIGFIGDHTTTDVRYDKSIYNFLKEKSC